MFFVLLSVFVVSQIVVVDDDILLCSLLTEVLSDEGYDVESFHSGEDALNYMQDHSVDLVLLDVMLPKLNGMQVARRICQRFATPILMLTALNDESSMLDGLQAGADQFLAKPFKVPELLARITTILRRVGLERQRNLLVQKDNTELFKQFARIPLTTTESELLDYLVKRPDIVISKSELQKEVLKKDFVRLIVILICILVISAVKW